MTVPRRPSGHYHPETISFPFIFWKESDLVRILSPTAMTAEGNEAVGKVLPVIFALIPLTAVVGAYVTTL